MNRILFALVFFVCAFQAQAATTLLPNGQQCFSNANGPLVSGSLNMFYPGTTTPKPTWQDSNQNTLNSQPIQLDANGCAIIYGVGSYRQQVYTGPVSGGVTTGSLVWDQLTTDTSAYNAVFWAGLAGGTPNVITVTDTGFNGTDGTVINFIAIATNTSSTTINPSGFGAIPVVKDTTAGPVSLTGGEITQNNLISVVYYAVSNTFHIVNTALASASGATAPRCGMTNLKIVNDAGTPNTLIDITADAVVTSSASGLVQNRNNVSVTLNISTGTATSTAGGMDGESAPTNGWIYIWFIDNGATIQALGSKASGNGLSPNLPSGYTYKCRAGAFQVDSSSAFFRQQINGQIGRYIITAATNTPNNQLTPMNIADGAVGGTNLQSPTLVAAQVTGDAFCAPLTATEVNIFSINLFRTAGAATTVLVARSAAYSGANNGPAGNNGLMYDIVNTGAGGEAIAAWIPLESNSVYWAAGGVGAIGCGGWKDSVNAP